MASDDLEFAVVTPERWSDLARLFEGRGGPSYCWCMVWRDMPSAGRSDNGAKRAALKGRVKDGVPVGILAYSDGEPVAWCSVAPRDTFRPLGGETYEGGAVVWAIVCFFATHGLRGTGISRRLIEAACDAASGAGATVIEAYPVDPDSPSYGFMGRVPTFLDAGFEELGMAGTRRHVMRKWLDRWSRREGSKTGTRAGPRSLSDAGPRRYSLLRISVEVPENMPAGACTMLVWRSSS